MRKQSTFRNASTVFPVKWHLWNEHRNSKLMMHDYPDLSGASDWLKQIGHAAWQVTGFARTLKDLENCSRCWKVLEFRCLTYNLSRTPMKRSKQITHVVEEPKKTDSRRFFALKESFKNGKSVLEKSMNFLFKKGYKPCNQKLYPDLGHDTSSVWNFCTHFSEGRGLQCKLPFVKFVGGGGIGKLNPTLNW